MHSLNSFRNIYFVLMLLILPISHLQAHEPSIWNIDNSVFFCEGKNVIVISEHTEKKFNPFNFKFSLDTERKAVTYKSDDFNFMASSVVYAATRTGEVSIVAEDSLSVTDRMTLSGRNFSYYTTGDKSSWLITAVCDRF